MRLSMKKYAWQSLVVLLFMLMITIGSKSSALADVNVGDAIDSSNWQKVQGLLPEPVLEYLKKGWITMKIGKLNYEPAETWYLLEGEKRNKGKYDIAPDGQMMEKATGVKSPLDFIACPFPGSEMDPKDPKFSQKFFYNVYMNIACQGSHSQTASLGFYGSKQYERYIFGPQKGLKFLGTEENIKNQKYAELFGAKDMNEIFVMRVTDPYELNGLATMTYSHLGNSPDKVFAYVPALRRVRTMTAAARSDSMFGTDYALDDVGAGFWGKPINFTFKYLRTQDALVQYASADPIKFNQNPDGSLSIQKTPFATAKFGYQTPGWKGKPWAVTNSIWVKRKVHIFELHAKDPYYNYGKMEVWGDAKFFKPHFKITCDRAGKRWKVMMGSSCAGYAPKNYPWGFPLVAFGDVIYDEQRDHATSVNEHMPGMVKDWNVKYDPSEFTMTGFAKLGK